MNRDFYRAFEERYYAPRDTIKALRKQYLPFARLVNSQFSGCTTFDLGCGRGEWLELMLELGFKPFGIDLDGGMLQACYEHNLPAQQGDAIDYLHTLADDSQAIVSAFHVVEHISFEQLHTLISEALRVLKPGGLLIMETPNPENIIVATRNFYLDPTHLRPIPLELLSFLPEFYGYARTKVLRLQESKELAQNIAPTLRDVFAGVSPDYAVIAQKTAPEETLALFDEVFNQEYGLSLDVLTARFDARLQQAEVKAQQAEVKAQQLENCAKRIEACTTKVNAELESTRQELQVVHQANHHHWQLSESRQQQIDALLRSRSWRITAPLRWVGRIARWFVQGSVAWFTFAPGCRPRRVARQALISLKQYVVSRPHLKARALRWLAPFPGLKNRLKQVGAIPGQPISSFAVQGPEQLSPRARQIYHDLQAAIEQHKQGQL